MSRTLLAWACALLPNIVLAQSPAGLWQSIDDASGLPRARISITMADGIYTGRIVGTYAATKPGEIQVCSLCVDDRKDKPLIGLDIIRGLKQLGAQALWGEGEILDPDKGKTYRLQVTTMNEGKTLQVRGFIGPFYRTQLWQRLP